MYALSCVRGPGRSVAAGPQLPLQQGGTLFAAPGRVDQCRHKCPAVCRWSQGGKIFCSRAAKEGATAHGTVRWGCTDGQHFDTFVALQRQACVEKGGGLAKCRHAGQCLLHWAADAAVQPLAGRRSA